MCHAGGIDSANMLWGRRSSLLIILLYSMDFNEDTQKLATTTRCYEGLIVVESIRIFNIEIFIPDKTAKTRRDLTVEVEEAVLLLNEE